MSDIAPVRYALYLTPDLDLFTFKGDVTIDLTSEDPVEVLPLNILELAIWQCRLLIKGRWLVCPFMVQPDKETLKIFFPEPVTGRFTVRILYQGKISDKLAGFYRSRYEKDGRTRYIAITQFQESDARRAFPCIDHPAAKAQFDVTMAIDPHMTAISNGTILKETILENGKKEITFTQSPKMSTYLLFFGVGEFEFFTDARDGRVRVVTLPGKGESVAAALDFGRKALRFCENYYGIPYPLTKLDMIAVPDFAFGAMENWGAITFRENLLLFDPAVASVSGLKRIFDVIAHEIIHQWFGNLVTPSDWKYLWLNESFATYFAACVVAHYKPDWEVWEQFLDVETTAAMGRDGLKETFPIEIPGGEHVVINTSTAPIIYNKGGSILRQIHGYLGDTKFQQGLRHFLNRHAFENASSHHLWESFEAVSHLPVTEMMKSWIEQPGYPVITVQRDGDVLRLSQERFSYLPTDSSRLWHIPVSVDLYAGTAGKRTVKVLITTAESTVMIDEDTSAYKVNAGQTGFYRVRYLDSGNMEALGKLVRNHALPPRDRWGLQEDLFALCLGAQEPLESYLDLLEWYSAETAYLPLTGIMGNLMQARRLVDEPLKSRIAGTAVPLVEQQLDRLGWEPVENEPHTAAVLRDQILWCGTVMGSERTAARALELFEAMVNDVPVHPDIRKSVMQVGAYAGAASAFEWFDRRFKSSGSEHERMNILIALGCFTSTEEIERALGYVLTEVPARNQFIPVAAMAANPHAVPQLWKWYVANLETLEQFHPLLYERVVATVIPAAGMIHSGAVKEFFTGYAARKPLFAEVIRMSLERLEIYLRFKRRNRPENPV